MLDRGVAHLVQQHRAQALLLGRQHRRHPPLAHPPQHLPEQAVHADHAGPRRQVGADVGADQHQVAAHPPGHLHRVQFLRRHPAGTARRQRPLAVRGAGAQHAVLHIDQLPAHVAVPVHLAPQRHRRMRDEGQRWRAIGALEPLHGARVQRAVGADAGRSVGRLGWRDFDIHCPDCNTKPWPRAATVRSPSAFLRCNAASSFLGDIFLTYISK
ncbi:hypothetical protein NB689_003440 [Xanthomonas sacchari]|nr:hypothetical protein [Xanthomonas sacchari]